MKLTLSAVGRDRGGEYTAKPVRMRFVFGSGTVTGLMLVSLIREEGKGNGEGEDVQKLWDGRSDAPVAGGGAVDDEDVVGSVAVAIVRGKRTRCCRA